MKDLKPNFKSVRKLCEEFGVQVELSFGKKFRAIVSNDEEIHVLQNGWDKNLIEELSTLSAEMWEREEKRYKEISDRLKNLDPEIFPDNLFEGKE